MGKRDTVDLVLVGLYITGAVLLLVAAYLIYIRKYLKRGKMKVLNNVILHTSRYDRYHAPTKFLLELPQKSSVDFSLLDADENFLMTIVKESFESGEYPIAFDPCELKDGVYFLSLKTDHASILRKITVEKTPLQQ